MNPRQVTYRSLGLAALLFGALWIGYLNLGSGRAPEGSGSSFSGVTQRGLFAVEAEVVPGPVPLNVPFELSVTLKAGVEPAQALPGRTLLVEGWMPGHGHGMLRQSQVDDLGDGRYRVRGMLFHMPGEWELRIKVIETRIEEEFRVVEDDQVSFEVVL